MKIQIANWNYIMSDSLVAQADEMSQLTNSDENNTNEIFSKGCAIEKTNTNLMTPPAKRSINEISDTTHGDQKYQIPMSFHSFNNILDHYYNDVHP